MFDDLAFGHYLLTIYWHVGESVKNGFKGKSVLRCVAVDILEGLFAPLDVH